MNPVIHTLPKEDFATETEALQNVLDNNDGLTAEQLKPVHTQAFYSWEVMPEEDQAQDTDNGAGTDEVNTKYPFGLFSVAKSEDLQNAKKHAMEHFKTFEGNIKRVETEEDEEHFVFTKVRQ